MNCDYMTLFFFVKISIFLAPYCSIAKSVNQSYAYTEDSEIPHQIINKTSNVM